MKQLEHIDTIKMNYQDSDFNFNDEIQFRALTLLTGANGSGKTMVLIHNWIMGTCINFFINDPDLSFEYGKNIITTTFNGAIKNCNFTGECSCTYTSGAKIYVKLEDGKCTDFKVELNDVDTVSPVVFLSKNTRTFEQLESYFKTRIALGADLNKDLKHYPEIAIKLAGMYRLFDIQFSEKMIGKLKNIFYLTEDFKKQLTEKFQFRKDVDSVFISEDGNIQWREKDSSIVNHSSSLSSGEQALLVMNIGTQN